MEVVEDEGGEGVKDGTGVEEGFESEGGEMAVVVEGEGS